MQGQRGIIGSLPEILEFDHGSTSGNAITDPHICWNIMSNPAENRLADFTISTSHLNNAHINPIDLERQNLSGWSLGEPSSISAPNEASLEEKKPEHSLSVGAGPRLEEREHERPGILSLDSANTSSQSAQSSNSNAIPQNLDLNAGFDGHGGDLGSNKSENDRKRKAEEGNVGQSSTSESPGFLQCSVNTAWSSPPAGYNAESSLSIAAPLEQLNPRLGLGLRGLASDISPDSSQRNFRLRINPSNQDSSPQSRLPNANAVRRSNVSSSRHSSRVPPADYSLDFRSLPVLEDAASLSQPLPVPSLPQNVQPFRWNEIESSSSRNGSSSSSITLGNREEGNTRNLWEHPIFVPATELRTSVRNPSNRTIGSTSRAGSSPGGNPLSASTWAAHPNPSSRSSRRLAEYVRRSLFSSANGESGGRSSNSPPHSGPAEAVVSSGGPSRGHHRSYPRSGSRGERQVDGVLGFPYPLRTLAAGEGRSRLLVSEIRNVLDLMRRGENLRFEDVMILDQSALFGVPDIHDRHRDMRLDVDNMSYEELLALEERIGNVSTGLSEETISKQLKQRQYSATEKSDVEGEPCCVCQEEYGEGENIGTLDCGHDFHSECIKQWLMLKNWCPICKTTGLAT